MLAKELFTNSRNMRLPLKPDYERLLWHKLTQDSRYAIKNRTTNEGIKIL